MFSGASGRIYLINGRKFQNSLWTFKVKRWTEVWGRADAQRTKAHRNIARISFSLSPTHLDSRSAVETDLLKRRGGPHCWLDGDSPCPHRALVEPRKFMVSDGTNEVLGPETKGAVWLTVSCWGGPLPPGVEFPPPWEKLWLRLPSAVPQPHLLAEAPSDAALKFDWRKVVDKCPKEKKKKEKSKHWRGKKREANKLRSLHSGFSNKKCVRKKLNKICQAKEIRGQVGFFNNYLKNQKMYPSKAKLSKTPRKIKLQKLCRHQLRLIKMRLFQVFSLVRCE